MATKNRECHRDERLGYEWISCRYTEDYSESWNREDYSDLAVKVPKKSEGMQHTNHCDED